MIFAREKSFKEASFIDCLELMRYDDGAELNDLLN